MKADVKSNKLRRIIYLVALSVYVPARFLFSCALVIWAYGLKPNPLVFKEFGIRVVTPEENGKTLDDQVKIYAALELLNRHDKESLELIKKYIRIIFVWPIKNRKRYCYYLGAGVFLLNLQKIPTEMSPGRRAVNIIGWLVYWATRIKFAGELGAYLRMNERVKNICKEEQQRTIQQFCK